ncbi:MAG: glycosyltransferase family 39 protein [Actinobacteria bacterium]|nr:glycosyltransferase family 39 protein [Actinomycetota bacterium]
MVMSLAAVPAYLLARRVLPAGLSLLTALLAVALPSLAYTGTLMTENVFYPAFLLVAWALVRMLERPSAAGQVLVLAACGVAVLARIQALALVLAALTAPLLLRVVARRPLRPYALLYGLVGGGAVLVLAAQLVRGASLQSLFGAYEVVGEGGYDWADVVRFLFWHVAELDLYVCVFPLAAFILLAARLRSLDTAAQAFVAASIALAGWTLLVVAAFASRFAGAIEERNMFPVAPLLLIALLVWIHRGARRPRLLAAAAATLAAVLPALIPYERFLQLKVRSDTLMIVPLWNLQDSVTLPRLDDVVLLAGLAAGALFVLVPRRFALVLPALVLAYYALAVQPIQAGPHGMERAAADALFEGIRVPGRDWIDRSVGRNADVAALWTGLPHHFTVNQNEFFSRSVGPVYTLGGPMPGGLPETAVTVDEESGEVRRGDGSTVRADYALTDGSVALDGEPVARDERLGLTLYRTNGQLISTTTVTGVYNDQWSGPKVTYRRVRCKGGTLTVTLDSDPGLFDEPQQVSATTGGSVRGGAVGKIAYARLSLAETVRLPIQLVPDDGVCTVRFTVSPTKVPGGGDDRELGVHFRAFEYSAP